MRLYGTIKISDACNTSLLNQYKTHTMRLYGTIKISDACNASLRIKIEPLFRKIRYLLYFHSIKHTTNGKI